MTVTAIVISPAFVPWLSVVAQETTATQSAELKTGSDFRSALELPAGIAWREVPLRQGLRNLSVANSIAIFLDRRVDPGQRVNFSTSDQSLAYLLYQIADQLDLGICFEADVVCIGPRDATDRLPTLLAYQKQRIASFNDAAKRKLRNSISTQWPMLAEPREIVAAVLEKHSVTASNIELIPHDVWYEGSLSAGRLDQQLTILLNCFDMMYVLNPDGQSLELREVPQQVKPTIEYSVPADRMGAVRKLEKTLPATKFSFANRKLQARGSFEDHATIYRTINPLPKQTAAQSGDAETKGKQVYSLSRTAAAGSVLATIAQVLDCELKYDPELRELLSEEVTIDAKNVSIEELLGQTLDPLDLQYRLDDKQLVILRKE